MDMEKRTISLKGMQLQKEEGRSTLVGYAAVFGQTANLGSFHEVIAPGAFKRTLASWPDVRATIEHEGGLSTIGRTINETLFLAEDTKGLRVTIYLPNTNAGRDAMELVRERYITQMSFAFSVPKGGDAWAIDDGGRTLRTLREIELHNGDVSLVSYPAYESTTVSVEAREKARQMSGRGGLNSGSAAVAAAARKRKLQLVMLGNRK